MNHTDPAPDRTLQNRATGFMVDFARDTGLDPLSASPRRYLWTDAFAVCTYLGLFRKSGDPVWRERSLRLIDQVHTTLGRHRNDDRRTGWISGLSPDEGVKHPTAGGLRIGKPRGERGTADPYHEDEEWDRDGQYFHYLAKWMHALCVAARVTGLMVYSTWATELAKVAFSGFVVPSASGLPVRMYWKMSIDLTRPLVPSMGQHDPLDGLVTSREVQAVAAELAFPAHRVLVQEISGFSRIGRDLPLATSDPLGTGGLLFDASRIARLAVPGEAVSPDLLEQVLDAALTGIKSFAGGRSLDLPAESRLAFRECGLSLGLAAAEHLPDLVHRNPALSGRAEEILSRVEKIRGYYPMKGKIEDFWLTAKNRESASWQAHKDINTVMLATSLAPEGFLEI